MGGLACRGSAHPGMLAWEELEAAGDAIDAACCTRRKPPAGRAILSICNIRPVRPAFPKGPAQPQQLAAERLLRRRAAKTHPQTASAFPYRFIIALAASWARFAPLVSGAAMVFPQEGFDAAATLEAVEAERCTSIYGVPTMFIAELEHPTFRDRDTSSLRTGIMAGQPLPDRTDEARRGRDGRKRNHDRLRPNGSLAADHHDQHRRSG